MQQVGGALGLAVLVTVFGTAAKHAAAHPVAGDRLAQANHVFVYAADHAFVVGTLFLLAAMSLVMLVIRTPRPAAVVEEPGLVEA